jgi:hypothetical protein
MEREGFVEIVKESWNANTYHKFDIDKWQEKVRKLRRHIKGWHINVEGVYRKEKKMLLDKMDVLDKKEEHTPLSIQEKELQVEMHKRLKKLLRDEEIKWRQRAKEKDLKKGDGYTKYFHLKASGRRKQNHISVLHHNGEEIMGDANLIKHVTEFYKALFGPSPVTSLRMDGVVCDQLNEEDRQSLITPFSLEEIKETIDELKHDKAAGPDGLPAEFYQKFWEEI